jgi:hypothetical protein
VPDEADVVFLVRRAVDQARAEGKVIVNPHAFATALRRDLLRADEREPGWVAESARLARLFDDRREVERRTGCRITGWRYEWGIGEGRYVRDPLGVDRPPTDAV